MRSETPDSASFCYNAAQMAKAQITSDRIAISDAQAWLAEVLRIRFSEVLSARKNALDPSRTDGVHEMRVAVRRLRSMIRDFAEIADKFPLRSLRKRLKALADSLGAVRDRDVFAEALAIAASRTDDPTILECLNAYIKELEDFRRSSHAALVKDLSATRMEDLTERFDSAMEACVSQRGLFQVKSVDEGADRIITKCAGDFARAGDAIYYPSSVERLHRMRITGKHLRYSLELFSEFLPDRFAPFVDSMRKMQSNLGEVHDCDVWCVRVRERFVEQGQKKGPDSAERETAAWLISYFLRRRTRAYRSALRLWGKLDLDKFAAKS